MSKKHNNLRMMFLATIAVAGAVGLASTASFGAPADLEWSIEVVDQDCWDADGTEGGEITLALDAAGNPHISYVNGILSDPVGVIAIRYAKWTGAAWDLVTIDDDNTYGHTGMALDHDGQAHFAYRESPWFGEGLLRYARPDGGGWTIEWPDPDTSMKFASVAIDSQNHPHIAYWLMGTGLKYARWTGTEWEFSTPDPDCANGVCLVLDDQDRPYISYTAYNPAYNVRCAHWDGTQWHVETVGEAEWQPHTTITLDSQQVPHVAYGPVSYTDGVWYAKRVGAAWEPEMAVATNVWHPSLVIDPQGNPHLACYIADDGALGYATKSGRAWDLQIIEDDPSGDLRIGRQPSLVLDDDGLLHLAYYHHHSSEPCKLKYATAKLPVISCPADITGDGTVDVLDLLEVLSQWGADGSADITGDGVVDVLDLLEVLAAWGPC